MSKVDAPGFDASKPHSVHQEHNKIQVFDQNGHLYDGVTQLPLDHSTNKKLNSLRDRYAVVDGAPFTTVKTTEEKVRDVIATIRASGTVDPDNLAKFERLFKNMLVESEPEVEQTPLEIEQVSEESSSEDQ